jgi:nicotinate-nucleotide adenylyltransferase
MRVALFGGSFDPVHLGHLAVARAAAKKFDLDIVYFAPADIPPHKRQRALAGFHHRFAMLALATAGEPGFVPSLIDAPRGRPNYSYETVLRLKKTLRTSDKLYFLIGIDAFKDIATWHKPVELLAECDFIVVSRPGYSLADIARALPERLGPKGEFIHSARNRQLDRAISLPGATLHLLNDVHLPVSSTEIRAAARKSPRQLTRFVPPGVAEFIRKEGLYEPSAIKPQQGTRRVKIATPHRLGITGGANHE